MPDNSDLSLRRSITTDEKPSKAPLYHFTSEPLLTHMQRQSSSMSHTKSIASSSELPKITLRLEDYEMGTCIGQGSSALVFIAKYLPTNTMVAIKIIDLDKFERNQIDELRVSYFKRARIEYF